MKILIIFGTIEGQTGKIARFLAEEVQTAGHEAVLFDAGDRTATVAFAGIDKVILAASVHERRHPKGFEMLLTAQNERLNAMETLLISVSLMAAFPDTIGEAREFVTEMKMRTGIEPDDEVLVAGAVRTSSYDYFASQVLRHVVLRGHEYDLSKGDHEFTDWDALKTTLEAFLKA